MLGNLFETVLGNVHKYLHAPFVLCCSDVTASSLSKMLPQLKGMMATSKKLGAIVLITDTQKFTLQLRTTSEKGNFNIGLGLGIKSIFLWYQLKCDPKTSLIKLIFSQFKAISNSFNFKR